MAAEDRHLQLFPDCPDAGVSKAVDKDALQFLALGLGDRQGDHLRGGVHLVVLALDGHRSLTNLPMDHLGGVHQVLGHIRHHLRRENAGGGDGHQVQQRQFLLVHSLHPLHHARSPAALTRTRQVFPTQ